MSRIKRIETALLVGLAAAVLFAAPAALDNRELAGKLVRLHVIANSDSEADQALKLRVRDRVVAETEALLHGVSTIEGARAVIREGLPTLRGAAAQTVKEAGSADPVAVTLSTEYFPTKRYTGFALPAGEYEAVRVVIGEGAGQNWWCVLFPPLCVPSASEPEVAAAAAGLSEGEIALITEQEGYVLKFRAAELYGEMKAWLARG